MPEEASRKIGKYLYAITRDSDRRNHGPIGIDGGTVYVVSDGPISAVVSDVPNERIRPERRHLAAHQAVLKRLMEHTVPLPVSFGVIADGVKSIERILADNREDLLTQFRRVAGKVEMVLRVTWDVPNIFDYFLSIHPELRSARDKYFRPHRNPTQEDKIQLGRMFDRILNDDREIHTEKVEQVLARYCFEIKRNKCRDEREVMNLPCLVGRGAQAEFEKGVFEAARLFDNSFAFDYSGPWAPHNFVEMSLAL